MERFVVRAYKNYTLIEKKSFGTYSEAYTEYKKMEDDSDTTFVSIEDTVTGKVTSTD